MTTAITKSLARTRLYKIQRGRECGATLLQTSAVELHCYKQIFCE